MGLRFTGVHVRMETGKRSAHFLALHLPQDARADFKEWHRSKSEDVFRWVEGVQTYEVTRRSRSLELTIRHPDAFSMEEVKRMQASWVGIALPLTFKAIEAVGRTDIDRAIEENVARLRPWDKNLG